MGVGEGTMALDLGGGSWERSGLGSDGLTLSRTEAQAWPAVSVTPEDGVPEPYGRVLALLTGGGLPPRALLSVAVSSSCLPAPQPSALSFSPPHPSLLTPSLQPASWDPSCHPTEVPHTLSPLWQA